MNTKEKLEKFEKYLRRLNFSGSYFHLKGNILEYFKNLFEEELKDDGGKGK